MDRAERLTQMPSVVPDSYVEAGLLSMRWIESSGLKHVSVPVDRIDR